MRIDSLIELLKMFPEDMQVYVQTCEGDLLSPLQKMNIWVNAASISEKYQTLNPAVLCITSYVKGGKSYETKNDRSGIMFVEQPSRESAGEK